MDEPNMQAMMHWLHTHIDDGQKRIEVHDLARALILEGEVAVRAILDGREDHQAAHRSYRSGTGARPSTLHKYVLPWLTPGRALEALTPLVEQHENGTLEYVILAAAAAYDLPSDY